MVRDNPAAYARARCIEHKPHEISYLVSKFFLSHLLPLLPLNARPRKVCQRFTRMTPSKLYKLRNASWQFMMASRSDNSWRRVWWFDLLVQDAWTSSSRSKMDANKLEPRAAVLTETCRWLAWLDSVCFPSASATTKSFVRAYAQDIETTELVLHSAMKNHIVVYYGDIWPKIRMC